MDCSPPKSLSDAGGGLCGLNVKYFFNYQSQIKGCEDTVTVFRLWSLVFGIFVIPLSIIEPKTIASYYALLFDITIQSGSLIPLSLEQLFIYSHFEVSAGSRCRNIFEIIQIIFPGKFIFTNLRSKNF